MTPNKIKAEAVAQRARSEALKLGNQAVSETHGNGIANTGSNGSENGGGVTRVTAEQSIASKMLNSAELIGSQIMAVIAKKAEHVFKNPSSIDDPETVADLGTMVNVSRKIAGLDKPELSANLSLSFGAFWTPPVSENGPDVERPRVVDV